nr:MAG TPA: hypothetical protein [Caudoviricetes sp.]
MTEYMVTTKDNPFDPFEEYDEWNRFDQDHGYNTQSYLARLVVLPEEPTPNEINDAINDAVDKIILNDVLDIYVRASREKEMAT